MDLSKRTMLNRLLISSQSLRASNLSLIASEHCPITTVYYLLLLYRYERLLLLYFWNSCLKIAALTRSLWVLGAPGRQLVWYGSWIVSTPFHVSNRKLVQFCFAHSPMFSVVALNYETVQNYHRYTHVLVDLRHYHEKNLFSAYLLLLLALPWTFVSVSAAI